MSENQMRGTATYSPEDNKLRFYPNERLSKDDYNTIRAYGFSWAPKQELFVAPSWSPSREDFLISWCGEIGDEDKSLVQRAEERAERFEGYSERRAEDARRAKESVAAITDNIPLGQPILIGYHSQRHAEKHAEQIQSGMTKAIKMWNTSKYWIDRAQGAVSSAKYKELPDVRARRIKSIEADKRRRERTIEEHEYCLKFWNGGCKMTDKATGVSNPVEIIEENKALILHIIGNSSTLGHLAVCRNESRPDSWWHAYDVLQPDETRYKACPSKTVEFCKEKAFRVYANGIEYEKRWIEHYDNRLAYEKAMLANEGGLVGARFPIGIGGKVLLNRRGGEWYIVRKVNMKDGAIFSVSVFGYFRTIKIEEITDYKPPIEGAFEAVKKVSAIKPICNYPGEGFIHQTEKEWMETRPKWSDFPKTKSFPTTEKYGAHRVRTNRKPNDQWGVHGVFLTDKKRVDPPKPQVTAEDLAKLKRERTSEERVYTPPVKSEEEKQFEALEQGARAGVQVVSANQLFPTPPEIANQMVELASLTSGDRVLEPSAGTGNLLQAIIEHGAFASDCVAVEINHKLASLLQGKFPAVSVRPSDFLQCNGDLGKYDCIIMNPPFQNGDDIKHIKHAMHFLNPGGRIVALCANGPRQNDQLKPLATHWEELPEGSFKSQGTGVNVALLMINAE